MSITINGTTGVSGVDGTASAPAVQGNDSNTGVFFPAADTVAVATAGVERLRIDASGNLGLGVTPSAWSAVTPAFELGTTGGFFAINNNFSSIYNAYYNGTSYIYKTSRFASQYTQASGEHRFFTAPSGTAGNAITFTQAMTLDASGNVGIGTTSPATKLDVSGTITATGYAGTVDGTNKVGYRNIPPVGTKTASYTLATGDVGKYVQVGTSGAIVIPDATFAEGDVVAVFNNTSGNITITCTITTAYIGGTDADKATVTLATRGVANIFFISGTVCVITGNVS